MTARTAWLIAAGSFWLNAGVWCTSAGAAVSLLFPLGARIPAWCAASGLMGIAAGIWLADPVVDFLARYLVKVFP